MDPCTMKMVAVAVGGFVAGFVAAKVFCRCGGNSGSKAKGPARREQPRKPSAAPVRQPIPAGSVEIYVGNLSYDMTDEQVRKTFEEFGKVDTVRVVSNHFNGKSKGFAFVVMPNRSEAEAAIAALDNKEVLGRPMRVNEARNTIKESV